MSAILSRIHNNAPTDDAELPLLELTCAAWAGPLRYALSHNDETVTLPGGGSATFLKSGIELQLPDASGGAKHDLSFRVSGATDTVLGYIDEAEEADEVINATVYIYTQLHRSAPQKDPLTLEVVSAVADDDSVQFSAQFRDIANSTFPRLRYTADIVPGLRYYSK